MQVPYKMELTQTIFFKFSIRSYLWPFLTKISYANLVRSKKLLQKFKTAFGTKKNLRSLI